MNERLCVCPACRTVLVGTLVFPKSEWVCLGCGWRGAIFDPPRIPATPEGWEQYEALRAEWEQHEADFIVPRSRKRGCEECEAGPWTFDHDLHASDEEQERDAAARAWLAERTTRRQTTTTGGTTA